MSPSQMLKVGAFALTFGNVALATQVYTIAKDYSGSSFFDGFNFFTGADPTSGFVDYVSRSVAESTSRGGPLIQTFANGSSYMGVDYWTKSPASGRASVRIETTESYQYGLFVADLAHMPASVCGTWPAFWTVNQEDYPTYGEIDILENISEQELSLETLHTVDGCQVVGNQLGYQMSGNETSYNCFNDATNSHYGSQSAGQGCSAVNENPSSYGSSFNAASGGVYAMEWTSSSIQIWNFGRHNIPSNLAGANPDTSTWGKPVFTTVGGACNIDSFFKNHQVIFNTDFCGSFAGLDYFWQQTSCYSNDKYPSCSSYVAANPGMYKDAYWTINSLKVYQKTNIASSSSSSSLHSSTYVFSRRLDTPF